MGPRDSNKLLVCDGRYVPKTGMNHPHAKNFGDNGRTYPVTKALQILAP